MGNHQSTDKDGNPVSISLFQKDEKGNYMHPVMQTTQGALEVVHRAINGQSSSKVGSGEYFAGSGEGSDKDAKPLKSIVKYRFSNEHESKRALGQKLVDALLAAGVPVEKDGDLGDVAKAIKKALPDPHKGDSYKVDAGSQTKVLNAVVKALNDAFTPGADNDHKLINTSYGLETICKQVSELVYSLSSGVHDEFLAVQANVVNALHNVKMIRKVMDGAHDSAISAANQLIKDDDSSGDASADYETFQAIYQRLRQEIDRQITMLSNILDSTVGPEQKVMQQMFDETSKDYKYIKKYAIGSDMGTKESADMLARLVSGVSRFAVLLTTADKALELVGIARAKYTDMTNTELEKAVDDAKMSSKDPEKLAAIIKASKVLRDIAPEDRSRLVEGRAEDEDEDEDEEDEEDEEDHVDGGAAEFKPRKSKIEKDIKKRQNERRIIFSDFVVKTSKQYNRLLKAIGAFGPKLGSEIPLSDRLMDLREAFVRLSEAQVGRGKGALEQALIGLQNDTEDRLSREKFLTSMRLVKTVIEDVMRMDKYSGSKQYFDELLSAVTEISKTIDFYSDVIKQKYGSADGGDDDDDDDYVIPEVTTSAYDLNRSVNAFVYFFYVAKVKENLKQTHGELASYGEKYTNMLGDAVACRLRAIKKVYDNTLEKLNNAFEVENRLNDVKAMSDIKESDVTVVAGNVATWGMHVNLKLAHKDIKKRLSQEYECKKNFYRAVQAVDMYMKEFTEGITAHPEDVADVKQMLSGVDLIGPWYDEKTGDSLAHLFDMFPADDGWGPNRNYPQEIWRSNTVPGAGGGARPAFVALAGGAINVEKAKRGCVNDTSMMDVDQYSADGAGIVDTPHAPADDAETHYYNALSRSGVGGAGAAISLGDPSVSRDMMKIDDRLFVKNSQTQVDRVLDNFQALKNIINATVRMGDKFGDKQLRNSVFMTSNEIFRTMMSYLKCSAMSMTMNIGDLMIAAGTASDDDNNGLRTSIECNVKLSPIGNNRSNFASEDRYFQMMVKAMASKILTVIGVYDLFERPSPIYDLTPTRMIIGGAAAGPEILSGAAELYFRLPRLAEFYRTLFQFGGGAGAGAGAVPGPGNIQDGKRISMIPEVSGVFSGFVRLMFLKLGNATVDTGSYSDSDMRLIIAECNAIYGNYSGENAVSDACNEFVMEINRRYGIVKKDDYESFYKMLRAADRISDRDQSTTNYAILPDEGEYRAKRSAPSDRYGMLGKNAVELEIECKTDLDQYGAENYWNLLNEFRSHLDSQFENVVNNGPAGANVDYNRFVNISYHTRINQARESLEKASGDARYEIAAGLIKSSRGLANVDVARNLMFYESVGVGLNVLTAATKMIQHIIRRVRAILAPGAPNDAAVQAALIAPVGDRNAARLADAVGAEHAQLRDLIVLVNGLTNSFGSLVKVRYPQDRNSELRLDCSGLRNMLDTLMTDVKSMLGAFGATMPASVIKKFQGTITTEGTVSWLEKNLVQDILKGKANSYVAADLYNPSQLYSTLDFIERAVDTAFVRLVLGHANFEDTFRELVYYNGLVGNVPVALDTSGLDYLVTIEQVRRPAGGAPPVFTRPAVRAAAAADSIDRATDGTSIDIVKRGMLMTFNQLLTMFLTQFYDPTSKKIYRGLIEGLSSGSFSQAIMNGGAELFNDISDGINGAPNVFNSGAGQAPPIGVLLQSTGLILKRLMTDSTRDGSSEHLISTLSEVPMFMREKMRAYLPVFNKMFSMIQQQGELIKNILSQTSVVLIGMVAAGANPADRAAEITAKQNMVGCINKIVDGCYTLANSAAEVQRELADEPKYLQTQENSIRDYQSRYSKLPLMPLSSVIGYLAISGFGAPPPPLGGRDEDDALPRHGVGTPDFKMLYGTRGMLCNHHWKMSSAPGIKDIMDQYKASSGSSSKLDESTYDQLVGNVVSMTRSLVDLRYYSSQLSVDVAAAALFRPLTMRAAGPGHDDLLVFSLRDNTSKLQVMTITESSFQQQQIAKMAGNLAAGGITNTNNDRRQERIYNIIDMNIIPVNVHALMRGIPLAPTYNYTYTFEQNAAIALGRPASLAGNLPANARDWYLQMLRDPYFDVTAQAALAGGQLVPGQGVRYAAVNAAAAAGTAAEQVAAAAANAARRPLIGAAALKAYIDILSLPKNRRLYQVYMNALPAGNVNRDRLDAFVAMETGSSSEDGSLMMGRPKFISDQLYRKALPIDHGRNRQLQYYQVDGSGVANVPIAAGDVDTFARVSGARFNTRILRNMMHCTNVQRVMRLRLNQELTQYRHVLVADASIANAGVTEFGNLRYSDMSTANTDNRRMDPQNETAGSRTYNTGAAIDTEQ